MSPLVEYYALPPDVLAWEYLKADPVFSRQLYADALFSVEAGDRALSESLS